MGGLTNVVVVLVEGGAGGGCKDLNEVLLYSVYCLVSLAQRLTDLRGPQSLGKVRTASDIKNNY